MNEPHYHLHVYISTGGNVIPSPFEGWATFTQIFNQRPAHARYAVVQRAEGRHMVWDLYHDDVVRYPAAGWHAILRPPPPRWVSDSVDGLIMKVIALYER